MNEEANPKLRKVSLTVIRVAILAMIVVGIDYVGDRLDWVRGESVPVTLAWIEGGQVSKGDYVVFEAQHPIINEGRPSHLTKQVACVAGESVHFDGEKFSCDGAVLGAVIRSTSDGRPIAVAAVEGVIPAGKIFVMGTHPRSFDSRYLGLLDESKVQRVRPLL